MFDVKDYCKRQAEQATEQVGLAKGKHEAYQDVADHLDPEKYCQDCGTAYYSWAGSRQSDHEPKCGKRAERLAKESTTSPVS